MQRIYTGECPVTGGIESIAIDYLYVPVLGTTSSNYKKALFDCSIENCPDANNCPIYASAPASITE